MPRRSSTVTSPETARATTLRIRPGRGWTGHRAGQYVRIGQVIGYVGCTGNCSGPHVHFEVRYHGQARDPQPYLKHRAKIAGGTATSATRVAVYKTPTRSKAQTARAAKASDRGAFSTTANPPAPQPAAQPAAQGPQPSSGTAAQFTVTNARVDRAEPL